VEIKKTGKRSSLGSDGDQYDTTMSAHLLGLMLTWTLRSGKADLRLGSSGSAPGRAAFGLMQWNVLDPVSFSAMWRSSDSKDHMSLTLRQILLTKFLDWNSLCVTDRTHELWCSRTDLATR
jgi:hypothetical protein